MIISLAEAQLIDENINQNDLDAYEQTVRQLTNNKFQNTKIRYYGFSTRDGNTLDLGMVPEYLRVGDTIEISESVVNDGLYTILSLSDSVLTLDTKHLLTGTFAKAFITKIEYPTDIRMGVEGLIRYNAKMSNKAGIKSESIARMSVTYYDVNANDNSEGFPASKLSFLRKYEKMRWG